MMMGGTIGASLVLAKRDWGEQEQESRDDDRASEVKAIRSDGYEDLVELAQRTCSASDPEVRQGLVHVYSLRVASKWTGARAAAELKVGTSSSAASVGKLSASRLLHTTARLKHRMLGAASMLDAPESLSRTAHVEALNAFVTSIGGGTDQIQKNIIGERVLGLDREPEVDRNVAFSDVRKAPSRRDFG
jgi:alkylation response protein AidB-like acyl-CoA dehydrogenase